MANLIILIKFPSHISETK